MIDKSRKQYQQALGRSFKRFNPRYEFAARLRDTGMTFDAMAEIGDGGRVRMRQLAILGYAQRDIFGLDACAAEFEKNPYSPSTEPECAPTQRMTEAELVAAIEG